MVFVIENLSNTLNGFASLGQYSIIGNKTTWFVGRLFLVCLGNKQKPINNHIDNQPPVYSGIIFQTIKNILLPFRQIIVSGGILMDGKIEDGHFYQLIK